MDIMKYFNRLEIVNRLSQPGAPSVRVLSKETGIPKAILYAWLSLDKKGRQASTSTHGPLLMTKRTKQRSPSTKFALLSQSFNLQGEALKEFCHKEGVTVPELTRWRDLALSGIELSNHPTYGTSQNDPETEVSQLKNELRRKNDALAEAATLLILQKKTSEILGGKK